MKDEKTDFSCRNSVRYSAVCGTAGTAAKDIAVRLISDYWNDSFSGRQENGGAL